MLQNIGSHKEALKQEESPAGARNGGAFSRQESEPINDYLQAFASLPAASAIVQAHHKPAGRLVQVNKEFDSAKTMMHCR